MGNTADIAVEFIERINRRDFDRLAAMMTPEVRMVAAEGETMSGQEACLSSIRDYTEKWPDFQIHIVDVYLTDEAAMIIGRPTGSCAELPRSEEIRDRLLYIVKTSGASVSEFQFAYDDTPSNRSRLGFEGSRKLTM